MSFFSILGTLLIRPLRLLFEVIYMMAERLIGNPGLSIIVLSLMMNFHHYNLNDIQHLL